MDDEEHRAEGVDRRARVEDTAAELDAGPGPVVGPSEDLGPAAALRSPSPGV